MLVSTSRLCVEFSLLQPLPTSSSPLNLLPQRPYIFLLSLLPYHPLTSLPSVPLPPPLPSSCTFCLGPERRGNFRKRQRRQEDQRRDVKQLYKEMWEETITQRGGVTTEGHKKKGKKKRGAESDFSGITKATRISCFNIFTKTTNGI